MIEVMAVGRWVKAIGICEGAGIVGSIFTAPAIGTWYAALVKPSFNPPNWVFGPVWTGLFLLMGIVLARAWEKEINLKWFWIQLGLNVAWSVIFFGLKRPEWAAAVIQFLVVAIIFTMRDVYKKDKPAAWLLAPYLAWVGFATVLNFSIWILNYGR